MGAVQGRAVLGLGKATPVCDSVGLCGARRRRTSDTLGRNCAQLVCVCFFVESVSNKGCSHYLDCMLLFVWRCGSSYSVCQGHSPCSRSQGAPSTLAYLVHDGGGPEMIDDLITSQPSTWMAIWCIILCLRYESLSAESLLFLFLVSTV